MPAFSALGKIGSALLPAAGTIAGGIIGGPTGAMIGGSLGSGLGSAIAGQQGADVQAQAAEKAAENQLLAAREAIGFQREAFETVGEELAPYREAGTVALPSILGMLGLEGGTPFELQDAPGYEFRLGEGIQALDRSAAARGQLFSGGTMKAVQRYGEGLASAEYGDQFNRLMSLAGLGQASAARTGAAAQGTASGSANALLGATRYAGEAGMYGGAARASGYAAAANAGNQTMQNLLLAQMMQSGGNPWASPGGNPWAGATLPGAAIGTAATGNTFSTPGWGYM